MKKKGVVLALVFIIAAALYMGLSGGKGSKRVPSSNTIQFQWTDFRDQAGTFVVKVPGNWKMVEKEKNDSFDSRVEWMPESPQAMLGNTGQISLTIGGTPDVLGTEEEFEKWVGMDLAATVSGSIQKLDDVEVGGEPGVMLTELGLPQPGSGFWTVTTWFRKDGKNYYINTMGNGEFGNVEAAMHRLILESFTFLLH